MVRQIVLDTETTGLSPEKGHRIIEIGCIELIDRRISRNHYRQFIQPEREIDAGAIAVHGITNEFLQDKPLFKDIVDEFLAFIEGAELIIHNAPFDVGFIDAELKKLGKRYKKTTAYCKVFDTLKLARKLHPRTRNTLDALCKRYDVNATERTVHGALLDAKLLAEVYLAMTGGQTHLELAIDSPQPVVNDTAMQAEKQDGLVVIYADAAEENAHQKCLETISNSHGKRSLWEQLEESSQ